MLPFVQQQSNNNIVVFAVLLPFNKEKTNFRENQYYLEVKFQTQVSCIPVIF